MSQVCTLNGEPIGMATHFDMGEPRPIEAVNAMGATIFVKVSDPFAWVFLHLLESFADIFVVERSRNQKDQTEIVALRSDRFPTTWDQGEATALVEDAGGVLKLTCCGQSVKMRRATVEA